jgi:RNA polymerase sigma-70 factor, ECF subfamily
MAAVDTATAQLVTAASAGDEEAFRRLFDTHRRAIHVHCYRLLGSLHDAEDATQETFLRAWRSLDSFAGRSSFSTWLHRIATNTCLDTLARQSNRVLPRDVAVADDPRNAPRPAAPELPWLEPYPDAFLDEVDPAAAVFARETMELAFLAAIQHLAPRQRAVLILREVLHWSAAEVADLLGTSVPAVNSALQRGRAALAERLPPGHRDATASHAADDEERRLVERYVRAWQDADVDALVALLKEDASMTMPPSPSWYSGREAIRTFFETSVFGSGPRPLIGETRILMTRANRSHALALYFWAEEHERFLPLALKTFAIADGTIREIVGFTDPALFDAFRLPPVLER